MCILDRFNIIISKLKMKLHLFVHNNPSRHTWLLLESPLFLLGGEINNAKKLKFFFTIFFIQVDKADTRYNVG